MGFGKYGNNLVVSDRFLLLFATFGMDSLATCSLRASMQHVSQSEFGKSSSAENGSTILTNRLSFTCLAASCLACRTCGGFRGKAELFQGAIGGLVF